MKVLLLIISLFLGIAAQAQTYAPYTGNKANGTAASKPAAAKTKKAKPTVVEETPATEEKKATDDFRDFMNKAVEQLHQKEFQKALYFYGKALEVSTKETAWSPLLSRGTLYAIMKDDEKAAADFTKAIETKGTPKTQLAIIYVMRGRVHAHNKRMDLACADVAKAKAVGLPEGFRVDIECN